MGDGGCTNRLERFDQDWWMGGWLHRDTHANTDVDTALYCATASEHVPDACSTTECLLSSGVRYYFPSSLLFPVFASRLVFSRLFIVSLQAQQITS